MKNENFIKTVTPGAHISFIEKDKKFEDLLLAKDMKLETIKVSLKISIVL